MIIDIVAGILIISFVLVFLRTFVDLINRYGVKIPIHMILYLWGGGFVFLCSLLYMINNPTKNVYYPMCALIISGTCVCMVAITKK